jgi:hypothetical protein
VCCFCFCLLLLCSPSPSPSPPGEARGTARRKYRQEQTAPNPHIHTQDTPADQQIIHMIIFSKTLRIPAVGSKAERRICFILKQGQHHFAVRFRRHFVVHPGLILSQGALRHLARWVIGVSLNTRTLELLAAVHLREREAKRREAKAKVVT